MATTIHEVTTLTPTMIDQLAELLIDVVAEGASVGFLPPLAMASARTYWQGVCRPGVVLLVAERDGVIVGTAQLQPAESANGRHRAEVCKVLVSPRARRQGIGRRLMLAVEDVAHGSGQTLLVLDTREGDGANDLYAGVGYTVGGRIPGWARAADGTLAGTVFWYKELNRAEPPPR